MTDAARDPSRSALFLGFELARAIEELPHEADVEIRILAAAVALARADRACLLHVRDGRLVIARSSSPLPLSKEDVEDCLAAGRDALERLAAQRAFPDDLGSNDGPRTGTDESIPLVVFAKAIDVAGEVAAVVAIVRRSRTFDPLERRFFSIVVRHARAGLLERARARRPASPAAPAARAPAASVAGRVDPVLAAAAEKARTRKLTRADVSLTGDFPEIVGKGPGRARLVELIVRFGGSGLPVLVLGESGTGKELVARALHRASARRAGPFVPVNAAALPSSLIEAELFGSVKGAFTGATERPGLFQAAAGGTIFLDEIGELPLDLQPKLLRVLQEKKVRRVGGTQEEPVDFVLVAATNRALTERVEQGTFRADLYYRLCPLTIEVAPLRERTDDLPLLVAHFLTNVDDTGTFSRPLRSPQERDGRPRDALDVGTEGVPFGWSWPEQNGAVRPSW